MISSGVLRMESSYVQVQVNLSTGVKAESQFVQLH